jgi:hypothetical protein
LLLTAETVPLLLCVAAIAAIAAPAPTVMIRTSKKLQRINRPRIRSPFVEVSLL